MNFKGTAIRLKDTDLPRLGATIGVGEDEIHAVLDVEARGSGYDSQGRPAMLFEPHVFYRNLSGAERDKAVAQGLAYRNWKRNYPKDSYPRLERAMKINKEAALRSASWGLGQILGENFAMCGYNRAEEMVLAFTESEGRQLEAMVKFIIAAGLDDELRRHDWAGFARGYNGPGYKKNKYDVKLRQAYNKWSKIKDTEWKRGQAIDTLHKPSPGPETESDKALANTTYPDDHWLVKLVKAIVEALSK